MKAWQTCNAGDTISFRLNGQLTASQTATFDDSKRGLPLAQDLTFTGTIAVEKFLNIRLVVCKASREYSQLRFVQWAVFRVFFASGPVGVIDIKYVTSHSKFDSHVLQTSRSPR